MPQVPKIPNVYRHPDTGSWVVDALNQVPVRPPSGGLAQLDEMFALQNGFRPNIGLNAETKRELENLILHAQGKGSIAKGQLTDFVKKWATQQGKGPIGLGPGGKWGGMGKYLRDVNKTAGDASGSGKYLTDAYIKAGRGGKEAVGSARQGIRNAADIRAKALESMDEFGVVNPTSEVRLHTAKGAGELETLLDQLV